MSIKDNECECKDFLENFNYYFLRTPNFCKSSDWRRRLKICWISRLKVLHINGLAIINMRSAGCSTHIEKILTSY